MYWNFPTPPQSGISYEKCATAGEGQTPANMWPYPKKMLLTIAGNVSADQDKANNPFDIQQQAKIHQQQRINTNH